MSNKQAVNPYLPSYEYIPDGEPHKFGNRIYLFGSHDKFNGKTFCMNDYVCWSAPETNLADWRCEGVIWRKEWDPRYKKGQNLYAPDVCCGPDGRYYLYYGFSTGLTRKSWAIRVAVADTPVGPYCYHGEVDLYPWSKEFLPFDPAVYTENGRVWLYYGSAMFYPMLDVSKRTIKGGAVVELAADMLTVIAPPKMTVPMKGRDDIYGYHAFFEASSVRKIGDKYYFVYSSTLGHELCYAISGAPDGPWTFGGTIVSIGDVGLGNHKDARTASNYTGNTHGSIVEANGKYYIFYHRQTNLHCFSRQGCAELIEIKPDGSIDQVEITSCGLNGKPLIGKGRYEARIACNLMSAKGCRFYGGIFKKRVGVHPYFTQSGFDRTDNPDQYIANMRNGAIAGFKYFDCNNVKTIGVKVCGKAKGEIMVSLAKFGNTLAKIPINSVNEWQEFSTAVNIPDGVNALYFRFKGKGSFNFDSFILE